MQMVFLKFIQRVTALITISNQEVTLKRLISMRRKVIYVRCISCFPQGSVLGPILFLIFINDMPEALNCCIKLFADDAKLYSSIKEENDRIRM